MKVVIGGKEWVGFSRVEVAASMIQMARTFSLQAETSGVSDIPFRKGQPVQISIKDTRVFTGFVELISITANESGVTYRIAGRDKMADVVDSTLDGLGDTGLTVAAAARTVLRYLGINAQVIDLADTASRPFEIAYDVVAPEPGDTAFQWLEDLARRRQVLLTSDGYGNLVITQGIGLRSNGKILHRLDPGANNVESMSYESDDSRRFGLYVTDSQLNLAATASGGVDASAEEIAGVHAAFRDPTVRATRRRAIASESSYPTSDATERARWEANRSRADGLRYTATMFGFTDSTGAVWEINTAPIVEDEFAGILGRMLIKAATWTLDERGETTRLAFTEPGAFQAALAVLEGQELG